MLKALYQLKEIIDSNTGCSLDVTKNPHKMWQSDIPKACKESRRKTQNLRTVAGMYTVLTNQKMHKSKKALQTLPGKESPQSGLLQEAVIAVLHGTIDFVTLSKQELCHPS